MTPDELMSWIAKAAFLGNEAVLIYRFAMGQLEVVPVAAGRATAPTVTPRPFR